MRKYIYLLGSAFILMVFIYPEAVAQKFVSTSSEVKFFSGALLEDIEAVNTKSKSVLDSDNGQIVFSIPINQFEFKKSLMKEHFNEKYMESDKYPKATFKGQINNFEREKTNTDAIAEGELEIHGIKKNIIIPGSLEYKNDVIIVHAVFTVKLEDYEIKIPTLLFQKIAEEVEVTISFEYKKYEK
jgi:hypothetical protein